MIKADLDRSREETENVRKQLEHRRTIDEDFKSRMSALQTTRDKVEGENAKLKRRCGHWTDRK
jgi:predicted  nucleic acid-binding Zn-ribbon protein